jgi:DNA-binding CsgD family transcriptional regulator
MQLRDEGPAGFSKVKVTPESLWFGMPWARTTSMHRGAEGAALIEEAITYVMRGRGERNRASSGWASLTYAERDAVRPVSEGLGNKDIATQLFVSPRTVQTHLTHVWPTSIACSPTSLRLET